MSSSANAEWALGLFERTGLTVEPGMTVLDFGCGPGGFVADLRRAGIEASGCDVLEPEPGNAHQELWDEGHLRVVPEGSYRIPFEDASFDRIFSSQVFEHIMDYDAVLAELRRVLKPGGGSFHVFPGIARPVEDHIFVPLATWFRARWWLRLWALLGVRNGYQEGLSAMEVAEHNLRYLTKGTMYLPRWVVRRKVRAHFERAEFMDEAYHLCNSPSLITALRRFPPALVAFRWLFGEIRMRVLVFGKAGGETDQRPGLRHTSTS